MTSPYEYNSNFWGYRPVANGHQYEAWMGHTKAHGEVEVRVLVILTDDAAFLDLDEGEYDEQSAAEDPRRLRRGLRIELDSAVARQLIQRQPADRS